MSENENAIDTNTTSASGEGSQPATATNEGGEESTQTAPTADAAPVAAASTEEITYHAVEKDGHVTAIWEMQGRKHVRTIDPRSHLGQDILRLYTTEHHDEAGTAHAESGAAQEAEASTTPAESTPAESTGA